MPQSSWRGPGTEKSGERWKKPGRTHKCLLETFRSHIRAYNIKTSEKIIRICFPWMAGTTHYSVLRIDPMFITHKSLAFQGKEWLSPKWWDYIEISGRLCVLSCILTHKFPTPTVNQTCHSLKDKCKWPLKRWLCASDLDCPSLLTFPTISWRSYMGRQAFHKEVKLDKSFHTTTSPNKRSIPGESN